MSPADLFLPPFLALMACFFYGCGLHRLAYIAAIPVLLMIVSVAPLACLFSVFLLVLMGACAARRVQFRRFALYTFATTFASYLAISPFALARYREVAELCRQYPVKSIRWRLAHLHLPATHGTTGGNVAAAQSTPSLTPATEAMLHRNETKLEQERWRRAHFRTQSLESLYRAHQGYVYKFVTSRGAGVGRAPREIPASKRIIEIPEPGSIPQRAEDFVDSNLSSGTVDELLADVDDDAPAPDAPIDAESDSGFTTLHENSLVDFVNPEGFGFAPSNWTGSRSVFDVDRVIGFQSHAFRSFPEWPADHGAGWRVERLELVSLLNYVAPAVYLSEHLPQMGELALARTRPLDAFESSALARLHAGEDVVVEPGRHVTRMFGSLRALRQCLDCHDVQRGALLGAFSYQLRREPAAPLVPPAKDAGPSITLLTPVVEGESETRMASASLR